MWARPDPAGVSAFRWPCAWGLSMLWRAWRMMPPLKKRRRWSSMCCVLCLRLPHQPEPEDPPEGAAGEQITAHRVAASAFASLRGIRHTILRTIGTRPRLDAPTPRH